MTSGTPGTCAILGLGAMGARMAVRLLRQGTPVIVWNRTASRAAPLQALGARVALSPGDAAGAAEVALVMVEGDDASRSIWEDEGGLLGMLGPGKLVVECSTVSAVHAQALTELARQKGLRFVAAPVSGSLGHAEAGMLTFLVGGAADDAAHVEPVLRQLSRAIHHFDTPLAAMQVKLAINGMLACQVASTAEGFALLRRAGLAPQRIVELIEDTPVLSPIVGATSRQIADQDYSPQFPISLAAKDMAYLEEAANAVGSPMPLARAAQGVLDQALAWRGENISAIAKLFTLSTHGRKFE